jgi:hypothetical protein
MAQRIAPTGSLNWRNTLFAIPPYALIWVRREQEFFENGTGHTPNQQTDRSTRPAITWLA